MGAFSRSRAVALSPPELHLFKSQQNDYLAEWILDPNTSVQEPFCQDKEYCKPWQPNPPFPTSETSVGSRRRWYRDVGGIGMKRVRPKARITLHAPPPPHVKTTGKQHRKKTTSGWPRLPSEGRSSWPLCHHNAIYRVNHSTMNGDKVEPPDKASIGVALI